MRIVFMGTPEFAVPSLEALIKNKFNVVGVFTQPDRPKGRGGRLEKSPVKKCAESYGLQVLQPDKIRNHADLLRNLSPDICVTAAFGQILTEEILQIPKHTINVHASLLPKHRGAAPIQWAILSGDTKTGVTTMLTDVGIDTGDMLLHKECDILPDDTTETLSERLSLLGADLLIDTLKSLDSITAKKQDNSIASYDPMIKKELGLINFTEDACYLERLSRAMQPWPKMYFTSESGNSYKITALEILGKSTKEAGTVIFADKDEGLVISTSTCDIRILRIAAPNKKEMDSKAYILGNDIEIGKNYKFAFK